ncbi:MAG: siderophore ABC transporter substrate-binding protein [Propioniciclava sp.]
MFLQRRLGAVSAVSAALTLALTGCAGGTAATPSAPATTATTTVTVTDNYGEQTVTVPPSRVAATDNRTFQTLDAWGIKLVAAPIPLMSGELSYPSDDSIADLGSHREPDLEAIVATNPDLVLVGQRYTQHYEAIDGLVPDATLINVDPRDGEPYGDELKRQVEVLGQVFGKETEAATLAADFDAAVARVQAAYNADETVMGLVTSGGAINYAAPSTGRTLGPVFDMLSLTPAIEADGTTVDRGDEISVEAIAEANPAWILVMDRDAGLGARGNPEDQEYTPANELIADSPALQNVTAVQKGQIVYMPADTYLNEGIQTYTTFLNQIADAMEAQS